MKKLILLILLVAAAVSVSGQARNFFYRAPVSTPAASAEEDIHYLFENDNTDESGNGRSFVNTSMTYQTTPTPWQGTYWGYSAAASTNYFTLPSSYTNSFPSDFSLAFTFRAPGTGTGLWLVESGSRTVTGFAIRLNVTGNDFDVFTNTTEINANNFGTAQNTDNHFVITYESSTGYVNIYVNGTIRTTNGAGASGITLTNAWQIVNGAIGYIDDFRVYPKILNGTEVSTIYSNPGDPL